jgi:hypothetical protein
MSDVSTNDKISIYCAPIGDTNVSSIAALAFGIFLLNERARSPKTGVLNISGPNFGEETNIYEDIIKMILFFYVPSRTSSTESAIPSIVKKK